MDFLTTSELLRIVLYIVAGIVTMVAYWVAVQALFPKFVREAQATYERPWLNCLIGAGVVAVVALLSGVIAKVLHGPAGQLVGGVLVVGLILLFFAGAAGFARKIGSGMAHPTDKDQPWRRTMRGGTTLGLTLLIPFLNIPPLLFMILSGVGASLRVLLAMRREKKLKGKVEEDEF